MSSSIVSIPSVQVSSAVSIRDSASILTEEALSFCTTLHRRFNTRRLGLLEARKQRQHRLNAGEMPDFLSETASIRERDDWKGPQTMPRDLSKRTVEITGPPDRKMVINALNSGADVFMVDFEDSMSPTWSNVVSGHVNVRDAVNRSIRMTGKAGKIYELKSSGRIATLMVRPRGWHLNEDHIQIDGESMSASLLDFGLFFFHNARTLLAKGSGPYFYLPKLEGHLEARLWNDVFICAQQMMGIPVGTIRATVLIETILAAFEMDEIIYELRQHSAGLNCGRWVRH